MSTERRRCAAFDMIGTVFSLEPVRATLVALGAPPHALDLWFAESLRDYFALSHSGGYAPLKEVLESALTRTLVALGLAPGDAGVGQVMARLSDLEAAPGAAEACEALAEAGWNLVALTNGSEQMTRGLLDAAGLTDRFEEVISCDLLEVSKPHARVYESVIGPRLHMEVWMVAAHAWDVAGAKRAGMRTAWISSKEGRYLDVYPAPDIIASDLAEAARQMLGTA